jgi:hypothetical protein
MKTKEKICNVQKPLVVDYDVDQVDQQNQPIVLIDELVVSVNVVYSLMVEMVFDELI